MARYSLINLVGITGFLAAGCASAPAHSAKSPYSETLGFEGKGLFESSAEVDPAAQEARDEQKSIELRELEAGQANRDLVMGMLMKDVLEIWGHPLEVQTAGDPAIGNQKWVYYDGLSSRWSLSAARVVYFESGKVAGWRTQLPH